jgi:NAD(P)-dependent dehydrogenase (short-subunit alcohol dehydrogenase family)
MNEPTSISEKTIVLTGATSGIGKAAALALAAKGARLIAVGRSEAKCQMLQEEIRREHPDSQIRCLDADLASLRQVRRLAQDIRDSVSSSGRGKIDVLINNAGTVSSWYTATEDGYELQFAVNHLAGFLLVHELLPLLEKAPAARVLTVSSGSHRGARMRWADPMHRRFYNCLEAYRQSKLANVLFSAEFNRRFGSGSGMRAYAVDPGLVNTEIGLKGTTGLEHWVWQWRRRQGVRPEQAAETIVFLAGEPALAVKDAVYWKDCRPMDPDRRALSAADGERLWNLSEKLCGIS